MVACTSLGDAGLPDERTWIPCECPQVKGDEPQLDPFKGDFSISSGRFENIFRVRTSEYDKRIQIMGISPKKRSDSDIAYTYMSGTHFEALGGRGKAKNFRLSILVDDFRLGEFLKKKNYIDGASSAKPQVSNR